MTQMYRPSTFERDSLRHLLKMGTKDIHGEADAIFMNAFMKLKISQSVYKVFVAQLYYLYDAMETAIEENKTHPLIGPIYFPDELYRTESLRKDLEYFYGDNWQNQIRCLNSMKAYVDHVKEIGKQTPELLIAHAYTRYLGDVSGGQILKKIIKRMYHLPGEDGTHFYQFSNITSISSFKDFINARMNDLELTPDQLTAIVNEAVETFKYNINVMQAILDIAQNSEDGFLVVNGDDEQTNDIIVPDVSQHKQAKFHLCPHLNDNDSTDRHVSQSCPTDNGNFQNNLLENSQLQNSCPIHKVTAEFDSRVLEKVRGLTKVKYTSLVVLGSALVLMFCPWFQRALKI